MLQAIGTGCGCADDRFRKTSLCSALLKTETRKGHQAPGPSEGKARGVAGSREESWD